MTEPGEDEWVEVVPSMRLAEFRVALQAWREAEPGRRFAYDDLRIDIGRLAGGGSFGRARVRRSALDSGQRLYRALISMPDSTAPGRLVSVIAMSLDEAKAKLETEHGEGRVLSLWNEQDAMRPR